MRTLVPFLYGSLTLAQHQLCIFVNTHHHDGKKQFRFDSVALLASPRLVQSIERF